MSFNISIENLLISSTSTSDSISLMINKLITSIQSCEISTNKNAKTIYRFSNTEKKRILDNRVIKEPTKWQLFAAKKHIKCGKKSKKSSGSKLIYDEDKRDFVRKAKYYKPK